MTNILIVGVGGQGTLLASKVLGMLALSAGYDVKVSELHGMAQRGGSVVTHVRFGDAVHAPLIDQGGADIILAFEKLEAARYLNYLKPGGTVIVNDHEILPMPVILGAAAYPDDVMDILKANAGAVYAVDAGELANACGNPRTMNVVLLGALARCMDQPAAAWEAALKSVIKPGFLDVNLAAFARGFAIDLKDQA
jgi:indolepyruvate ferredoxin oxidoreductase beta subunit